MAKKGKKKNGSKTTELGLTGKGVEPLVIPAIEKAAEKFDKADREEKTYAEVTDDCRMELMTVMHEHRDKLPKIIKKNGADGGHSYRYGDKLVILGSSRESVRIKSVHDDVPED